MKAAKLNVGYPGVFHQALPKVSFRCAIPGDHALPASLTLRAVGDIIVKCGDRPIYQSAAQETAHSIELPKNISADDSSLRVDLESRARNAEDPSECELRLRVAATCPDRPEQIRMKRIWAN